MLGNLKSLFDFFKSLKLLCNYYNNHSTNHNVDIVYMYKDEGRFRMSGVPSKYGKNVIFEEPRATKIDYRNHMTIRHI